VWQEKNNSPGRAERKKSKLEKKRKKKNPRKSTGEK